MHMCPFRPPQRAFRALGLTGLLLMAACSSGGDSLTTDSSLPSTTAAAGQQSAAPEAVATIDPATASTVVQPEATTTTTTTTTTSTSTIPVLPDGRTFDPVFDPILEELAASSGVPVRLPEDAGVDGQPDIVATLSQVDATGYLIHLGFGPCDGGNVCRVATFTGSIIDDEQAEEDLGLPLPLPNGIDGRFHDATCGANCGDGTMIWTEGNARYSVGEKLATGPEMLKLAWASIDPDATPPTQPIDCRPDPIRDTGRGALIKSDAGAGLHWLTTCNANGIRLALLHGPGQLSWFDIDNNGELDLALTFEDGTTTLLLMSGIETQPVMDFDTFDRLVVDDLRCMDLDGDGRRELIDGADGSVFEFINPASVVRAETTVDNADSFDRCF